MRQAFAGLAAAVVVTGLVGAQAPRDARPVAPVEPVKSGVVLGDLTWPEAEKTLTDSSVVVIPLGLATEQHGPHLRLNNKERLARYLAGRVQAAAPVVIAPAPPAEVRTAAVVQAASCEKPEYPPAARRANETGTVRLQMLIDENGKVVDSKVERSSGSRRLDEAARAALELCRFRPATVNGKPTRAWARLEYVWTLE